MNYIDSDQPLTVKAVADPNTLRAFLDDVGLAGEIQHPYAAKQTM